MLWGGQWFRHAGSVHLATVARIHPHSTPRTALSYTCGFLFTNMAFGVVTASFAETVKSGEPINSVIFGWFVLGEKSNTILLHTDPYLCRRGPVVLPRRVVQPERLLLRRGQ